MNLPNETVGTEDKKARTLESDLNKDSRVEDSICSLNRLIETLRTRQDQLFDRLTSVCKKVQPELPPSTSHVSSEDGSSLSIDIGQAAQEVADLIVQVEKTLNLLDI